MINEMLGFELMDENFFNDQMQETSFETMLTDDVSNGWDSNEFDTSIQMSEDLSNRLDFLEEKNNITFEGSKSNEEWYDYYQKKAEHAFEQEKWHCDRAAQASARGDEVAAKDHIASAKAWHSDAEGYLRSAKIYKNI